MNVVFSQLNAKQAAFMDAAILSQMAFIRAEREAEAAGAGDKALRAIRHEARANAREFIALIGQDLRTVELRVEAKQRLERESE